MVLRAAVVIEMARWWWAFILLGWRLRGVNELAKRDSAHDYSRS